MAKLNTIIIFLTLLAATIAAGTVTGANATISARRSRFLLANSPYSPSPPPPPYAGVFCSEKSAAGDVCLLAPGSQGPMTCCGGQCVDTMASANHCGGCSKVCNYSHSKCCGGGCVDLLNDKDNCGVCGNRCNKKCSNGFCDYAL